MATLCGALMLHKIELVTRTTARIVAIVGLSILLCFAATTLVDGLSRSILNSPLDVVRDLGGVVVAIAGAACLPYAFMERSNIVITFLGSLLGPRTMQVVGFLAALATLIVMGIFAWQFFLYAGKLLRAGEFSNMLRVPKAPWWYLIDAIFWFTVVVQLLVVVRELTLCFAPTPELILAKAAPAASDEAL